MAFAQEQRQALYFLQSIENGSQSMSSLAVEMEDADPALVYFILTWLRERYKSHPAAEGVIGRIVELTGKSRSIQGHMREGKADSIVTWFEEEYSYRDFQSDAFIELIVEKLES